MFFLQWTLFVVNIRFKSAGQGWVRSTSIKLYNCWITVCSCSSTWYSFHMFCIISSSSATFWTYSSHRAFSRQYLENKKNSPSLARSLTCCEWPDWTRFYRRAGGCRGTCWRRKFSSSSAPGPPWSTGQWWRPWWLSRIENIDIGLFNVLVLTVNLICWDTELYWDCASSRSPSPVLWYSQPENLHLYGRDYDRFKRLDITFNPVKSISTQISGNYLFDKE